MTGKKVDGFGKTTVTLGICIAVIVVLSMLNARFYTQVRDLQDRVNDLETGNSGLINYLESQVSLLQSEIEPLQSQINLLESEIVSLEAPQLNEVDVKWGSFSGYTSINGTLFNSGTNTAYDVAYTVEVLDDNGTLLKSERLQLGTILGKSYLNFDADIVHSGNASYVITSIFYGLEPEPEG